MNISGLGAALLLAMLGGAAPPSPQDRQKPLTPEEVKAGLLYNFSSDTVTRWPPSAFADPQAPFVLGLLSPGDALHKEVTLLCQGPGIKAQGRPIRVERSDDPAKLKDCHLVFVAAEAQKLAPQILQQSRNRPVLTVSETEGFCAGGGILNLFLEKGRFRFEANPEALAPTGLSITANTLAIARIVKGKAP